ncbi:MAG: multidrug transporter, partial [Xanthobacteraceae bacterium]
MSEEKQSIRWLGSSRKLLGTVAIVALGSLLVWGFFAGRDRAAVEGDRDRVVKAPLRVSAKNGATVITIDDDAQKQSGIKTQTLEAAPHQEQIRAYGMVLDIERLTELSNRYANAQAQVQTAQAKLAYSRVEFERDTKLYNDHKAISEAQMQSAEATF